MLVKHHRGRRYQTPEEDDIQRVSIYGPGLTPVHQAPRRKKDQYLSFS